MILDAIIGVFLDLLNDLFNLIPPVSELPFNASNYLKTLFTYLVPMKDFLPLGDFIAVFGLVITFETAYLLFKVFTYVYTRIRG
jgi:hypothetical protein